MGKTNSIEHYWCNLRFLLFASWVLPWKRCLFLSCCPFANSDQSSLTLSGNAENFPVETWTQITLTHNDSIGKIYFNGDISSTLNDTRLTTSRSLWNSNGDTIGKASWFNGNYFSGSLDEVRFYDRALSDGEVNSLHLFESISSNEEVSESWTFTNAGASGRLGPTQTQVNSAYAGSNLEGAITINTQGIQNGSCLSLGLT